MFYITKISKLIIPIILINSLLVLSSEYYQSFAQNPSSKSELVDVNKTTLQDSVLDTLSQVAHQKTVDHLSAEQEFSRPIEILEESEESEVRYPISATVRETYFFDCQEYVKRMKKDFNLSEKTIQNLKSRCPYKICSKEAQAWYAFLVEEIEKKLRRR
jgi:hypothetical protein